MRRRSPIWMVLVTGLALTLPACGGDGDGGSEESEAPASLAEIKSCAEEAGFATSVGTPSAISRDNGVVGTLTVLSPPAQGLASVSVLEFETEAEASDYVASVSKAEDSGKFVIDSSGGEDAASVTEGVQACVT